MKVEDQINQVFKKSWDAFANQFVVLILGTLVAFLMMLLIVTIAPMMYGLYILIHNVFQKKEAKVSDVFKGFEYFFRSWGLFLLIVLGVIGGLILLIVPGILLMIMWQYALAISVSQNKGITDSMRESYHLAKRHFSFSALMFLLAIALSVLGDVTKIGFLLTTPFVALLMFSSVKMLGVKKTSRKKVKKAIKKKKAARKKVSK